MGAAYVNLATPKPEKAERPKDSKDAVIPVLLAVSAAYLALCFALLRGGWHGGRRALVAVLAAAFVVRLIPACLVKGYGVDMGCFTAWAAKMASAGPAGFSCFMIGCSS